MASETRNEEWHKKAEAHEESEDHKVNNQGVVGSILSYVGLGGDSGANTNSGTANTGTTNAATTEPNTTRSGTQYGPGSDSLTTGTDYDNNRTSGGKEYQTGPGITNTDTTGKYGNDTCGSNSGATGKYDNSGTNIGSTGVTGTHGKHSGVDGSTGTYGNTGSGTTYNDDKSNTLGSSLGGVNVTDARSDNPSRTGGYSTTDNTTYTPSSGTTGSGGYNNQQTTETAYGDNGTRKTSVGDDTTRFGSGSGTVGGLTGHGTAAGYGQTTQTTYDDKKTNKTSEEDDTIHYGSGSATAGGLTGQGTTAGGYSSGTAYGDNNTTKTSLGSDSTGYGSGTIGGNTGSGAGAGTVGGQTTTAAAGGYGGQQSGTAYGQTEPDNGVRGAPIEGDNVKGYAVSAPVGSGDTANITGDGNPSGQVSGAHMEYLPRESDNRDQTGRGTTSVTQGDGDSSFANVKRTIPGGTEHVVTKSSNSHIEHVSTTQL